MDKSVQHSGNLHAPPFGPSGSSQTENGSRPQAGLRREGRAAAIQFLFHLDFHSNANRTDQTDGTEEQPVLDADFWRLRVAADDTDDPSATEPKAPIAPKARAFAESLVGGVWQHLHQIDALISRHSRNYQLQRLAAVDRNILRLAVYEILHNKEVPPVVAINEAIELAKQYGSEESGRFVNGLLDRIRSETPRPPREGTHRPKKA